MPRIRTSLKEYNTMNTIIQYKILVHNPATQFRENSEINVYKK